MSNTNVQPGTKIVFGRYKKQIKSKTAPILPLTWTILNVSGDTALILCNTLVDYKPFNTEEGAITWKNCSLRKWLNFDFVKEAFSMDEIDMLECRPLLSDLDVKDRVFVLSVLEIEEYLSSEKVRAYSGIESIPARATLKHGLDVKKGDEYWWTRTGSGSDPRFGTMLVHVDLNGFFSGATPTYCDRWIRPACFISVSAFTKPAAE